MTVKILSSVQDADIPVETGEGRIVVAAVVSGGIGEPVTLASIRYVDMRLADKDRLTVNLSGHVGQLKIVVPDGTEYEFHPDSERLWVMGKGQ